RQHLRRRLADGDRPRVRRDRHRVDKDAITAPGGSIFVTAGRDILFGTVGTDHDNDVRANNNVTLMAGRDITIDGFADVASDDFGQNTGGSVFATAGLGGTGNINVSTNN